ncbi:stage V sporulation protein B [Vallitalea longa]|uniref:Stage V sporulation protein B n=1 Tax=Vallitalea longa TaxID=2936439 RepID=A0A9W5YHQ8_9FIRM|nr:stage V sporulation protein B [Vallitalea longa]GKX31438.1 stage V sporulation protein B [Vallitalea longa]
MKKSSVIKGTIILTIAALITRILGFANRIYLSNLIGAEGMGLYQLVFPIYMICYTICCSGIFTAVSKLVAEEKAKNNNSNLKRIIRASSIIAFTLSIILMLILIFNADLISSKLINEPRTALAIKIMALSIPFTAIMSCIKGYFYGLKYPTVPALSQILEQITRITIIYLLSSLFIPKGLTYACAMAIIGMVGGEIISFATVAIAYKFNSLKKNSKKPQSYYIILKKISAIAVPITSNRLITTILTSIETILIPTQLQLFGFTHSEALSTYGILTGMALPLILFPSVFTNSISLMLLPTVSAASANKNKKMINFTTTKTMKFTILIGIISTFLFLSYGKTLGVIVYQEEYVGILLTILAWLCPFIYLQTTLGSILNGLNKQLIVFRNNIIGLSIRIAFIFILIPMYGLKGYLWGLLSSFVIVSTLNIIHLIRITSINFKVSNWLIKPILACLASVSAIDLLDKFITLPFSLLITTLINICLFMIITAPLLLLTGSINMNEVNFILNRRKKTKK